MRGTILGVHDARGFLLTSDDRRLDFPLTEWRSPGLPASGQAVDFVEDGGQVRGVFAVPGLERTAGSRSMVLSSIALGCLVLGFIIPFIPTVAAFVLGIIGAGQAQAERDDSALVLARISWIGALVLLAFSIIAVLAALALIGTIGLSAIWHGAGVTF